MKSFRKTILFSVCFLVLASIIFVSCNKAEIVEEIPTAQLDLITDYDSAIEIFEKHIIESNGVYLLDVEDPNHFGIEANLYKELSESLSTFNQKIETQEISIEEAASSFNDDEIAAKGCNQNKVKRRWYGFDVYLSRANASSGTAAICLVIGSRIPFAGSALCFAIVQALSRGPFCRCGYKVRVIGPGIVYLGGCQ